MQKTIVKNYSKVLNAIDKKGLHLQAFFA